MEILSLIFSGINALAFAVLIFQTVLLKKQICEVYEIPQEKYLHS